jgi:predicted phage baseplate assembly protein
MALPTPQLDDRRFQDIVDEAKSRIPRYCKEWTDHNVSDPGIALIELFAWMTDLLLYRVNQVPDKLHVTFLNLIGVHLEPPRAARAPVTIYLSAPQPNDVTIPEGTEVATVRTETTDAIVFTTDTPLTVRTARLNSALTARANGRPGEYTRHDVRRLEVPDFAIRVFSSPPVPGDAFYLGLERDHSRHVLAVMMACDEAAGAGVDPNQPPLIWEAWGGLEAGWIACDQERDTTRALNVPGEVLLHMPVMAEQTLADQRGYWLRCRVTPVSGTQSMYYASPLLGQLRVESRGGTVNARHATTVYNEVLGRSDGSPGQKFKLLNAPLLARDPHRDYLLVEPFSGPEERQAWHEVEDFAESIQEDLVYTLDGMSGELTFGPSLLQPNGKVFQFGATPAKGARLIFARYQYGGGTVGNAAAGALSVLKSSIPYVARVVNREAAVGGTDAESLEHAKLRAPQFLRSRTRAVTCDDFVYLANQVDGVWRAYCLAPGIQPGAAHEPKPGTISVLILPKADQREGLIEPRLMVAEADLLQRVQTKLDQHRLLGTTVEVRAARHAWISVAVTLRVPERTEPAAMDVVRKKAEESLYRYLNPYIGGPQGNGWPLGRDLNRSELFGLLQQIPGVEYADNLRLTLVEPNGSTPPRTATQKLVLAHDTLVCSAEHVVKVDYAVDEN